MQGLKPAPPSKHPKHIQRYKKHGGNGKKKAPFIVDQGNAFEVHSEDTADHRSRCHQAGYDGHHLHHFIHLQVYIIDVEVLHADHDITVVFTEVKGLVDVILHVFEILGSSIIQQVAFTADDAADQVTYRG